MKAQEYKAICRWVVKHRDTFVYGFELFDSIGSFHVTEKTEKYAADDIVRCMFAVATGWIVIGKEEV